MMKMFEDRIIKTAKRLILGNEGTRKGETFYERSPNNIYLTSDDGERIGAFYYAPRTIDPSARG